MTIKVSKLKEVLQEAIDVLDDYEDNAEVQLSPNTYGLNGYVLEIPYTGFVDIRDMTINSPDDDYDVDNIDETNEA